MESSGGLAGGGGNDREGVGLSGVLRHILIVYDLESRQLLQAKDLGEDGERAASVYSECESRHRDDPSMEIVLIGAESMAIIEQTHAQYFSDARPEPLLDLFSDERACQLDQPPHDP